MSVNSSSAHLSSSNSSIHPLLNECFATHIYVVSAFYIINILFLLPVILVLYLGYQQWRQQRSVPTAATMSPTDCLTYHSIHMQLNGFLGFTIFLCGDCFNNTQMVSVGFSTWTVTSFGQALVHLLTCVVHYLAVVHPITYLGLKKTGRVRIGNISICCVWLLSFTCMGLLYAASSMFNAIMQFCIVGFILIGVSFCCISVLSALKRPGPGEVAGDRERVDHSKQRAFNTIMVIMGVLWFTFGGTLIGSAIYNTPLLSPYDDCVLFISLMWFDLPSSLVLPLLFLYRAGKLQCCKQNTESG